MAPDSSSSQVVAEQVRKRPFRPGGWTVYGQVGVGSSSSRVDVQAELQGFFQNENLNLM